MAILGMVLSTFEVNSIGQRLSLFNEKVAVRRFEKNSSKRVA
jgi:hypothetical protein